MPRDTIFCLRWVSRQWAHGRSVSMVMSGPSGIMFPMEMDGPMPMLYMEPPVNPCTR
jgi:hypothetical protein